MTNKISAIVLKTIPFGDNDLILSLLSKELGRIDAIAKGVRRSKKSLLYAQPFAYSDFNVFRGKNMYTINSADLKESFYNIRNDILTLALGQYFLETMLYIPKSALGEDCEKFVSLLLNSLFLMCKTPPYKPLIVKTVFELKYAFYSGLLPDFENCAECGSKELFAWVFGKGLYCEDCSSEKTAYPRVNMAIQKALLHIVKNEGITAYSFILEEDNLKYLNNLTERYLDFALETKFKTLEYYRALEL